MKRRYYVVWHQDSPGSKQIVRRRFVPRSCFSRVGERTYDAPPKGETLLDMTRPASRYHP